MTDKEPATQKSSRALEEEQILSFWKENNIFEKTLAKESPRGDFVFYEGPPTANGKPGIHHLEARSFKDVIPRFKTMQGFHVGRKGGWDTHGLPVELQVEKELGLKSKKEIESFGVSEFNKRCKQSVFTYLEDWSKFTDRIGYWVDQKDAYYTFHNSYIESLWGVVNEVDKKGLLYKDYKVVPWCARCGTGLSSHELAQGYEEVKDLSVYVKFKVTNSLGRNWENENTYFLAWTTTPWTLPGNVALATGHSIGYVRVRNDENGEVYIMSHKYFCDLKDTGSSFECLDSIPFSGDGLVGVEYQPLFPFLKENTPEAEQGKLSYAFKVYAADFVNTTDGTGIVHVAPMYGADDFALGTKESLPKVHTVGDDGRFKDWCGFLAGRFVKEKDENGKPLVAVDIIEELKKQNLFFKQENIKHSYPHCWRCKTPLIYFARDSWYIKMSSLRDTLVAENQNINWEPDYIKEGRFGEWLREIKDWAISRERYWGTPLPIWETEDKSKRVVIDSLTTLKQYTKKSGNKYFLMRHGEAEQNVKGILSSDNEEVHHLTEAGKLKARETAQTLKDLSIDIVFYSPVTRTKETAEILQGVLTNTKFVEDVRLKEEYFGVLSGKPWSEFEKVFPTFEDRIHKKYEDLETLTDVKKRIGEFLYEIEKTFQGKNILIITHDGPAAICEVVSAGAYTDEEFKEIYKPGEDLLSMGGFMPFEFTPLPHDDEYRLDFHKPFIDEVELVDEIGQKLARVKEVMDVWFDSGAMPFAQNADGLGLQTKLFPADFISEAIDQTRGWFYTLHAVGCLMERGHAYKNVICLGHLLDKNGKKMSKSLGNVINPFEMIDKYGVDTLRLWMYSVNQPGESKNFDERTVDELSKKVFNLLSNVLSFYELYRDKNLENTADTSSTFVLDRWILSRLSSLNSRMTTHLEGFKLLEPVREMREFIDDLSTWFLRRSRDRLREGNKDALSTLYVVLKTLSKLLAPFAPFFAESVYQKLKNADDKESVHLEEWPNLNLVSDSVEEEMAEVRKVVSLALDTRQKANIKVRQPLKTLVIQKHVPEEYFSLIADEVNVKEIIIDQALETDTKLDIVVTEELREEGILRELVRLIQDTRKEKGFSPVDLVSVTLGVDGIILGILEKEGILEVLKKSVLAKDIKLIEPKDQVIQLEGGNVSVEIT